MTGEEIFSLVVNKEQEIEELLDPTTFVRNMAIEQLEKEIASLQAKCPHEFVEGVCKFCKKKEENE